MRSVSILLLIFIFVSCNAQLGSDENSTTEEYATNSEGDISGDPDLGGEAHGNQGVLTKQPNFKSYDNNLLGAVVKFQFLKVATALKLHYLKVEYFDPTSDDIKTKTVEKILPGSEVLAMGSDLPFEIEVPLGKKYYIRSFIIGPVVDPHHGFFPIDLKIFVDDRLIMEGKNILHVRPMNMWVDFVDTQFIPTFDKTCDQGFYLDNKGHCSPIIHLCSDKTMNSLTQEKCKVKIDGQKIDCYWAYNQQECTNLIKRLDICTAYKNFTQPSGSLYNGYFKNIQVHSVVCSP